jgi:hypothetical protein
MSSRNDDVMTLKYAPDGTLLWAQGYDNGTTDNGDDIAVTADGDKLWVSRVNGPSNFVDAGNDVAADAAGYVYVIGYLTTATQYDYATVKLTPGGEIVWTSLYDGPVSSFDTGRGITVDEMGNVYVTGTSGNASGDSEILTLKLSGITGDLNATAR